MQSLPKPILNIFKYVLPLGFTVFLSFNTIGHKSLPNAVKETAPATAAVSIAARGEKCAAPEAAALLGNVVKVHMLVVHIDRHL